MQATSTTANRSKDTIDHENLNIIIRPRAPRRRQSGTSLVPFRPYVKKLSSVRQPFSYANGSDKWMTMGRDETFFTQPNARCIGTLLEDCDVSEVIRWDIEAESTRLPMMCKLWMIVDGAIVERGKPHLVQDAAVQVLTAGRNLRTILAAYQRHQQPAPSTSERRRRHSWHEVNEYHSVPYYQYTNVHRNGSPTAIQCDRDNEQMTGEHEVLSDVEEEVIEEQQMPRFKEENLREMIHQHLSPRDRALVSMTTQTEAQFSHRSTSIDAQLVRLFNLNLESNEILLSSIVNPYRRALASPETPSSISIFRNEIEYKHRSTSTGDDFPRWWLQLTTDLLLSDSLSNQGEEKEKFLPSPSPSQHDQSVQTEVEQSRATSSTRSSRFPKSSSSTGTSHHYELNEDFDEAIPSKRYLTFSENSQRVDSGLSDCQIETPSMRDEERDRKQVSSDQQTFLGSPRPPSAASSSARLTCHCSSHSTPRKRPESPSTSVLASLLERYEKTLRERQQAIAVVNDELLDIDELLKRYRGKTPNPTTTTRSETAMELHGDVSLSAAQAREDRATLAISNFIKDKYRAMPGITGEEMLQGYIPSPRIHLATSLLSSPRQRQPRFLPSTSSPRPDYCELCLTDHPSSSAWIRYNERRIEELHKRIDLMLHIDDSEEARVLLTPSSLLTSSSTATVSQRIDDLLALQPRYRLLSPRLFHHYRLPYRSIQSVPASPRPRTRSTTPVSKSVRISTRSVPPPKIRPLSSASPSRPLVSILRRSTGPPPPPHVWTSQVDGQTYTLDQFSIPRYYRLYNDAEFREVYNFSRVLDSYLDPRRASATTTAASDYSTMVKSYALDHQLPAEITSAA